MQVLSVFPDITEIVNFWWKDTDVRRIPGVCHVIYIFFDLLLGGYK